MKLSRLGEKSLLLAMFFATFGPLTGQILGIKSITLIYNWLIILSFLIFLVANKYKISLTVPKYLLLFVSFILFHILITYVFFYPYDFFRSNLLLQDSPFINLLRFLVFIVFIFLFIQYSNYKFFKSLIFLYSLGYILAFLVSYTAISKGFLNSEIDFGGRFTGGSTNANNFGMASFMVFILNIYVMKRDSELKSKINYLMLFFIVISLVGIFLSGSRSILFGLVLLIIYLGLKISGSGRKLKFIASTLLIILILYSLSPRKIYENVFNRISTHSLTGRNGVQESRILIWTNYLNKLPSYYLTGEGFNRELSINQVYNTSINFQPHNEFLIVLVQFGILGLFLYLIAIRQLLYSLVSTSKFLSTIKQNNFSFQILVALFIVWIVIFLNVGQYQTSREYWLMIAIVCSSKKIQESSFFNANGFI